MTTIRTATTGLIGRSIFMRQRQRRDADGFTLIEVMVAISVASILMAITLSSYKSWATSRAERGAADGIVTTLRLAHERAITEGISQCVRFDTATNTYSVYRYACDDTTNTPVKINGPVSLGDGRLSLAAPGFLTTDGSISTGVTFRPTGSAWAGSVQVTRANSSKTYTISVEGFTGRVSQSS